MTKNFMSSYPFRENPSQTLIMDDPKSYFFQLSRQIASDRSLALKVSLLTLTLFREYELQQYTMILLVNFLFGYIIMYFQEYRDNYRRNLMKFFVIINKN